MQAENIPFSAFRPPPPDLPFCCSIVCSERLNSARNGAIRCIRCTTRTPSSLACIPCEGTWVPVMTRFLSSSLFLSLSLEISSRDHPVDFVFGSLQIVELHIDSVLPVVVDPQPCVERTNAHPNKIVPKSHLCVIVSLYSLPKGEPRAFPRHLCFFRSFLCGSVRQGNQTSLDLQRPCELVEHLLEVIERQLHLDQLIAVRLHLRCVLPQLF
mmetsp:Transcript_12537/g.24382  ORF Transcript_12537/g.24382 Transcript_12537/m.24382 type:complete len:212 (+) Transcript_12537:527-1162(+)